MSGQAEVIKAIQEGNAEKLRGLIANDPALASAKDETGVSALLHARYRMREDLIEILLAANPQLDIFEAAALGKTERATQLLQQDPALVHAWSADGFTALHLASFFGHEGVARALLERGAEVGAAARNATRVMPLHSAVATGQYAIAKMLLERGAPANARQQHGFTPLHSAANRKDAATVELLLKHGADPSLKSDDGKIPADFAEKAGGEELARKLRRAWVGQA